MLLITMICIESMYQSPKLLCTDYISHTLNRLCYIILFMHSKVNSSLTLTICSAGMQL